MIFGRVNIENFKQELIASGFYKIWRESAGPYSVGFDGRRDWSNRIAIGANSHVRWRTASAFSLLAVLPLPPYAGSLQRRLHAGSIARDAVGSRIAFSARCTAPLMSPAAVIAPNLLPIYCRASLHDIVTDELTLSCARPYGCASGFGSRKDPAQEGSSET